MTGPLVTVGLPVYNGGSQLREALESLCAQDHPDLDIVISDNASTDGTAEMCAEFAARDHRIRYFREPVNRGATWNFNRVLEFRRGDYFMWAAHDDVWLPTFVSKAVAALEADPGASICHSYGQPFTATGQRVGEAYVGWVNEAPTAPERYRTMLEHWELHAAIYGVLRGSALSRTRGLRLMLGGELVFMAEMCIQGKIIQVPEVLQLKRVPAEDERYHRPAELMRYLSNRQVARRRVLFQRLQVSWHCAGGVLHARLPWRTTARMIVDTVLIYLRRRYWSIDVKESVEIALGPERFARVRGWARRPSADGG